MENRKKYGPEEYAEELVNMEEWDEGAGAAHNGYLRIENPYPKELKKWEAWNAGFDAECKTMMDHTVRITGGALQQADGSWEMHLPKQS